ncbi:hypothetical protein [Burkholderia multivorans]|uniref:hypothetical protein n=1 Tax=Burkholderia multivorans TaxID=87883 RepID=UPI000AAF79E8|nr:hypothetical protein [Burkholderia multivorans]MDR9230052.1 hypothetical protein [Burkholderia multivorans]HDR9474418.1 hypothetical protein [Burkholderia multivorans]HDR9480260.1 hypothetical protein [Burkholderia multivorans]
MRALFHTMTITTLLCALVACGQRAETPSQNLSAAQPVADPVKAARTYYDGTDTGPWLALNKACKEEVAAGKKGVNCEAYVTASAEANKLIRANPAGFVGLRVRLK